MKSARSNSASLAGWNCNRPAWVRLIRRSLLHACLHQCMCGWEWVFPSFDLSSAQKQAEGLITAMIPCQAIIYIALSEDADSYLILTLSLCVCVRLFEEIIVAYILCLHLLPFLWDWIVDSGERFFSTVCMFTLVIYLWDAVWSVQPRKQTLLELLYLLQNMTHPSTSLVHHSHKITPLRTLRRELDDTITHICKTLPPLSPLDSLSPPSVSPSNWFSPLYGCPLATTFDPYSTLTSACPYQRWL